MMKLSICLISLFTLSCFSLMFFFFFKNKHYTVKGLTEYITNIEREHMTHINYDSCRS